MSPSSRVTGSRTSRRPYVLAAMTATALAVYGSLVPLRYEPLSWEEAVARFSDLPYLTIGPVHRADWVANVLLLVPIGFLWSAALSVDSRSRLWRGATVLLVAGASGLLAIGIEFTQLWFPRRTVSQNDIMAETIGGLAGALLWLAAGQAVIDWMRMYVKAARPKQQIDWLLEAYLVGFVLYAVMPLDLTLSSGELAGKLRAGRVVLVPFADLEMTLVGFYGLVRDIVVFIPVGVLIATWRCPPPAPARPLPVTALLGGAFAAMLEGAQLLVLSRFTTATDVVLGSLGAAAGGYVALRWQSAAGVNRASAAGPRTWRFLARLAVAAAWAAVVVIILCGPFEVSGTWEEWGRRYRGFWAVPFARLYTGSEYNAMSDVIQKVLLFGGFGALLARAVAALELPRAIRRLAVGAIVVITVGLAFGIELLQVFLPPHVPDVSDLILAAIGAAIAVPVVLRLYAHGVGRARATDSRPS